MAETDATAKVSVEIAYAEPGRQFLCTVELASGASVADALQASNVETEFAIDITTLDVGIWSRRVSRDALVVHGDRIELYRPLKADPKESRRRRAARASPPNRLRQP